MVSSNHTSKRRRSNDGAHGAHGVSHAARSLSLAVIAEHAPNRRAVESSIIRKFETRYGAHLTHFLPHLVRLAAADNLGAVAGVGPARDNTLFLEQYLDKPVEQAIAAAFMTPVDRDQVVEIGNLAANMPGLAYSLFAILATAISDAGYKWVACTATPQVAAMLAKMNFSAEPLCDADPSKLTSGSADWGDYYASRPRVMAGDVQLAAAQARSDRNIAALMFNYRQPIAQMVAELRRDNQ
jgi:hypothetical protein